MPLLLPRHGIEFYSSDVSGVRFAALFRATWKRIPLWARRRILSHWRKPKPTVFYSLDWVGRDGAFAQVARDGYALMFCAADFEDMPDAVAQDVIAHELAHVVQHANGMWWCRASDGRQVARYRDDPEELEVEQVEDEANELIFFWDFDESSVDDWAFGTGRIRMRTIAEIMSEAE